MRNNKYNSQPEATAPGNPSIQPAQNSVPNAVVCALALLSIYRPSIPRHFSEAKPVCWLLDADDQRACEVSSFIDTRFDLHDAAKSAGPTKRVVSIQLTDLSKLNAYLCAEGQMELPPPPLGDGYIVVCSAGTLIVQASDSPTHNNLTL